MPQFSFVQNGGFGNDGSGGDVIRAFITSLSVSERRDGCFGNHIALECSALIHTEEQDNMSARIIRLSQNLLILLLSGPQSITHGGYDVVVIPRLDHEVSYTCHIVQSAYKVRCTEEHYVD